MKAMTLSALWAAACFIAVVSPVPLSAQTLDQIMGGSYGDASALSSDVETYVQAADVEANNDGLALEPVLDTLDAVIRQSMLNIQDYYDEAEQRYGALPSDAELLAAKTTFVHQLIVMTGTDKVTHNPPLDLFQNRPTPKIPLNNRQVQGVDYVSGYAKPFIPPMRWSYDGRIGVVADTGGVDGVSEPLRIRLQKPEQLKQTFLDSMPGAHTVDLDTIEVAYEQWGLPQTNLSQFVNLCDAKPENTASGVKGNPYQCGVNGEDDCYDMTLIGSGVENTLDTSAGLAFVDPTKGGQGPIIPEILNNWDRLFGVPIHVRVTNPKTSQAKIEEVRFGEPKVGDMRMGVLFETITPDDGRLFVARRAYAPLVWKHTRTGQMKVGNYDLVYGIAPLDADPCDVTQWTDLYPISHAPYDSRVNGRYLFAKYPFRDPMGNTIADGADMKGTYPWIDKEAKVMTMQVSPARLIGDSLLGGDRYPNRCVNSGCTPQDRDPTKDLNYVVFGGWTKGKMVSMDNLLNAADFRMDMSNALYLDLYQPGSAKPGTNPSNEVAIGGTRSLAHSESNSLVPVKNKYGNEVGRILVKNSSVFDSIENRFNYNPNLKPVMPHDVVWNVSSGAATEEFSFDDYLNNHAFIISNMVGAFSWMNDNPYRMTYYDGWHKLLGGFEGQVRVENAATTLPDRWRVPHSGYVSHGRLEPVANGGVVGKGLWFSGSTKLQYGIPGGQPQAMHNRYWYHSLFIDARNLKTDRERVILNFPDKSRLTLRGSEFNIYNNYGEREYRFSVPAHMLTEQWFNLGLLVSPYSSKIEFFANGYPFHDIRRTTSGSSVFALTPGNLVLGQGAHRYDTRIRNFWDMLKAAAGGTTTAASANYKPYKGWMDGYKVFAYKPDYESICNLAHGTLIALSAASSSQMHSLANGYSAGMHQRISGALAARGEQTYSKYVCYQNNLKQGQMAHLENLPENTVSVRTAMHFPEGPLYHNVPRPDSSTNEFCLACHSNNGVGGLTIDALRYNPNLAAKYDPRRQPSQPPAYILGNTPPEFIQSINGEAGAMGSQLIDEYILQAR